MFIFVYVLVLAVTGCNDFVVVVIVVVLMSKINARSITKGWNAVR